MCSRRSIVGSWPAMEYRSLSQNEATFAAPALICATPAVMYDQTSDQQKPHRVDFQPRAQNTDFKQHARGHV